MYHFQSYKIYDKIQAFLDTYNLKKNRITNLPPRLGNVKPR